MGLTVKDCAQFRADEHFGEAQLQAEVPLIEDLQEVIEKLRSEMETLRREPPDEQ
jgi:hypothetical protein